jgi:hypothetical protein
MALALPVVLAAQATTTLPSRDRALEAPSQTLFSVGVLEGAEHEMFSQLSAVAFDGDGNLYVLDRGSHRVVVFDPDGGFRHTIGRRGSGPGEFQGPIGLAVTGQEVAILDMANNAVVVFRRDGHYLRNIPFESGDRPGRQFGAHPLGGFVYEPMPFSIRMEGGGAPELKARETLPVLWRGTGANARVRTLFEGPAPAAAVRQEPAPGGQQRIMLQSNTAPIFSPTFRWQVLPDGGLATASGDGYRLEMVDRDGRVTRIIERAIAPRRTTDRDRERVQRQREEAVASSGGFVMGGGAAAARAGELAGAAARQALANLAFAETIPVIQGIAVDPAGRLWIRRAGAGEYDQGPVDIVGADGRYFGTLPDGTRLPSAFGPQRTAAYIEADDLGVQRVVVRRVPDWTR